MKEKPIKRIRWGKQTADRDALSIQREWEAQGFRVHFILSSHDKEKQP